MQGPVVGLSFARSELGQLAPNEWAFTAAKALLRAMARIEWLGWTEDELHALRCINNPLWSPRISPVEDGKALLSLKEQRDINEHFEESVRRSPATSPASPACDAPRTTCATRPRSAWPTSVPTD